MLGNIAGNKVIELTDTDSTNSYASRLLHSEIPEEGTVILAHFQKAGRGQRGSGWESDQGKNLLVSYIFYPTFLSLSDQFLLNQSITLGVFDFIRSYTPSAVNIKWPNDILIGNQKVAGILVENSIRSSRIIHSICGLGININQTKFSEFDSPATSLAIAESKEFDILLLLKKLNRCIDKWYSILQLGNYNKIRDSYSKALYLSGEEAIYESKGEKFRGKITGVLEDGRLEIKKSDGTLVSFMNKEVRYIF